MPDITKIVITGGPCAGKTTGLSKLVQTFSERGYKVLCIAETATEMINGGVTADACSSPLEYQKCLLQMQMDKERLYQQAAMSMPDEKILIICDRGTMDNKAYLADEEFAAMLEELGLNEVELRDGYDAVFHLVTAAKGALDAYTTENNSARTETPEQASEKDDKTLSAWTGQPHLRMIDNSTDFDNKIKRLIKEVSAFLGIPMPMEIEHKYLIKYPDIVWLESLPNCQRVEIIQTYLKTNEDSEVRVRQRGIDGDYVYIRTTKRKASDDLKKRIEIEERITQREYLASLMDADPELHPIRKDRYCLMYNDRYFEIDVYPCWDDKAIMEIEMNSDDDKPELPKEIEVIRDVTDDAAYKNHSLAQL